MTKFGKWIGGGLGWAFLGPIGGLIGFALGAMVDGQDGIVPGTRPGPTTQGDFITSLVILLAAVMKSDGKILKSELDFVKEFFIRSFGPDQAQQATLLLREILGQNIPVDEVSRQISQRMNYSTRLELLHLLFGVSKADGLVSAEELKTVERIASGMGIKPEDFKAVKALFSDNLEAAYSALEITQEATDEEIKKAYRRMAVKYHPDKVAYLGEELRIQANEKFQQLNAAYEKIKKARGLN
jgi:DnaJ like chaperone protein